MIEFMPYLGWLLCGFIAGTVFGMSLVLTFAVWWSRMNQKREQKKTQGYHTGVQDPPYYNPN